MPTPRQNAFAILFFLSASSAVIAANSAFHFNGELSSGHDSNPAQTAVSQALAFAALILNAEHQTRLTASTLTLGLNGWQREFTAGNVISRLTLHSDWSRETAQGAGLLTLALAATAYRDTLVPADERDEAALTLRYDHALSARDSLGITGETRQLAYRHTALPWSGRPGSAPRGRVVNARDAGAARPLAPTSGSATGRSDWRSELGIDATHHWSPTRSTVISLTTARCASPLPTEAYTRHGSSGLLRLEPAANWFVELSVDWARLHYDAAPQQQERIDTQRGLGLALRRSITGNGVWFCRLDWLVSDSTRRERAFQQQVSTCGLAWSF